MVGDADGSGVADAFEIATTGGADANGNGIDDAFEAPTDPDSTAPADTNENAVDDSFEAALTGGEDADGDGVDDAAAAAAADAAGGADDADDTAGPTGALDNFAIGDVGIGSLSSDGSAITGTVEINEGVEATGVSINTGNAALGNGQLAVVLNGESPSFSVPENLSADQTALISENIASGNLFLEVALAEGSSQTAAIPLPGTASVSAALDAANAVPPGEALSTGQGFMTLNTETGDYVVVVTLSLDPADVDADGNSQTISGVQISNGAAGETGAVIVALAAADDGTWTAQGTFSETDLATVSEGNANFSALGTDGSEFLRGQIPAQ